MLIKDKMLLNNFDMTDGTMRISCQDKVPECTSVLLEILIHGSLAINLPKYKRYR